MPSDLTISIINHSNPQLLRGCLRSVYSATHQAVLEVWVVDNATNGEGVLEMQAEFPQVQWLFNSQKLGFSANHNQVLRRASSRYACILNDDTIIHDGAFDTLIAFMDANPEVGMSGAKLLNTDGTLQNCTFRFSHPASELIAACFLPEALCFLKKISIDPAQHQPEARRVDWVLGACLVVRQSALDQIGLLDPVLAPLGNGEDVDWCLRAHKAGWAVAYCPDAVVTHYGGQSFSAEENSSGQTRIDFKRTSLRFAQKHSGWAAALLLRAIFVLTLPWNLLMLTQTFLRGRTSRCSYAANMRITLAIAKVGISKT